MTTGFSSLRSLRRVFSQGFFVHDIAEPLVSFDASAPAEEVRRLMDGRQFEMVGVRRDGLVAGYVQREELAQGRCGDFLREFEQSQIVDDSVPLNDLVLRLNETPRLFVKLLGRVGGIVTRSDLQKPPFRMWLFGMITLIEMRFNRLIERYCPQDQWRQYLSATRLEKAEQLLAERMRLNQNLGLLDCLQIGDKGQIIARNETIRNLTRYTSRRQVEQLIRQFERLRNNLAHSQDIIAGDWETIVQFSAHLDEILLGPPGLRGNED